MIKLVKYEDLKLFKRDVLSYLEQFETENNLILGVLLSLCETEKGPILMAMVIKDNDIGLVLLQTHPSQIILSKSLSFSTKEIHDLGDQLSSTIQEIPGFIGEKELTTDLAMYISNARGMKASVLMNQRIYKLEKVVKKINTNGMLQRVIETDHPTIKEWVYQFCQETNQPISVEEADEKAKIMIKKGNVVAWVVNEELVSMAYATRPTQNNITISCVYTPINERGKGYASDCVSSLTQSLLDRGYNTTNLYTDLSNPTSNKIYIQIGYEAIMDSIVILFK